MIVGTNRSKYCCCKNARNRKKGFCIAIIALVFILLCGTIVIGTLFTIYAPIEIDVPNKSLFSPIPQPNITAHNKSSSDKIKISFVCPTYIKRQPYHKIMYQQFVLQNFPADEMELVVYEDVKKNQNCSQFLLDVNKTDHRVNYICVKTDTKLEIGEKRNLLLKAARGEIIVHIDDDDFYTPSYARESYKLFQRYHDAAIVIRLKYYQYDTSLKPKTKDSDGPSPESKFAINREYFYHIERPKVEYWGFAWAYNRSKVSATRCKFKQNSYQEEEKMAKCVENKLGKSKVIHNQVLSTSFAKIDSGRSTTSIYRPSSFFWARITMPHYYSDAYEIESILGDGSYNAVARLATI